MTQQHASIHGPLVALRSQLPGDLDRFEGWEAVARRLSVPAVVIGPEDAVPDSVRLVASTSEEALPPELVVLRVAGRYAELLRGTRAVRSPTTFVRDLPIDTVLETVEGLWPGVVDPVQPPSSALGAHLEGRVGHLGHGGDKVHPDATGFDVVRVSVADRLTDPRDVWCQEHESLDTVVVTADWDADVAPRQRLSEAVRLLVPGGKLVVAARGGNLPSDLERLLADVAVVEQGHRIDAQLFTAVRVRSRSFLVDNVSPMVSVLIVGEVHDPEAIEVPRLEASILTAHASLSGVAHEILVLLRHRPSPLELASLRELAHRTGACHLVEDLAPYPLPQRFEVLRRRARGRTLIVLSSGSIPLGDGLLRLATAAQNSPRMVLPRAISSAGQVLVGDELESVCFAVSAAEWPIGNFSDSAYASSVLWSAWADTQGRETESAARVVTDAVAGQSLVGNYLVPGSFDRQLRERAVTVNRAVAAPAILFVVLRTMGDCILATAALEVLRERNPDAQITVLTEGRHTWTFRHNPAVDRVLAAPAVEADNAFFDEQEIVADVIEQEVFDRLILLTDRLDSVPYFRAGMPFGEFYGIQAGVREAGRRAYHVALGSTAWSEARATLLGHGVTGEYAVVHTRAGWPDRSPPLAVFEALRRELVLRRIPVVVVGGSGEQLGGSGVVELAGQVDVEVSAAIIAGARLFAGPDSGSMHIASSFDVPTLGLYAGTSMRLVPPQSREAIAVQAVTSCARPCGVTPCAIRGCSTRGLLMIDVQRHVAALLDNPTGSVAGTLDTCGQREWFDERPACIVAGPEGFVVEQVQASAGAATAAPALVLRPERHSRSNPVRVESIGWQRDPLVRAMTGRRICRMRAMDASGEILTCAREPALEIAVHHAHALGCLQADAPAMAVGHLLRAIQVLATSTGVGQRDRVRLYGALERSVACYEWPEGVRRLLDQCEAVTGVEICSTP